LSSQRNLADVAHQLAAKGPLGTYIPQKMSVVEPAVRSQILQDLNQGQSLKSALIKQFGGGALSCRQALGI
jgi:hypothetical protein